MFADFSDTLTLSRVRLQPPKCQHLVHVINSQKVVRATLTFFLKMKKENKRTKETIMTFLSQDFPHALE